MTEDAARLYINEVILVLEWMHNNNDIYRDLKCENICLDTNGHLRLIDYNTVKHFEMQSQ